MAFLVFFFLSRKTHFILKYLNREGPQKERTRPSMIAMKYSINPILIEYLFLVFDIIVVV
jgi:hypothetical protein